MIKSKSTAFIFIGMIVLFSGCVSNQETNKPYVQVSPTPIDGQDKIIELENKINSMQQQINDLQTRIDRVDLLKPSNESLIPEVPFRIRVDLGRMESSLTYTFKELGEVEIIQGEDSEIARYELFPETNTINIYSKKFEILGLVLYDEYITGIYENGWIAWVYRYQIIHLEEVD